MIKVDKNIHPPVVRFIQAGHRNHGKVKWKIATKKVIRDYNNTPLSFNNGVYQFNAGYGYTQFRDKLEKCQGPKCCFCEKPVNKGQIEHFRPTKGWKQAPGNTIARPGYYWLAYKWENMLISCAECNHSGQKGNLFPVNGFRATNHNLDYTLEDNIIINPAEEDPFTFISFNLDVPVGIDGAGRGLANIGIFKLRDRGDLKPIRNDRLELYMAQKDIASLAAAIPGIPKRKINKARNFLKIAQTNRQPFAGMIIENVRKGLI